MKTLDEAMIASVMRKCESEEEELTENDCFRGENLAAFGDECRTNELVGIYLDGVVQGTLTKYAPEIDLPEEVVNLIYTVGMSMFVSGVRVGVEMEKPEVAQ